jgi:hypothetical protein
VKESKKEGFIVARQTRRKFRDTSASLAKKDFQSKPLPSTIDKERDGLIKPVSLLSAVAFLNGD